ncbi:MAG: hypothetical protein IJ513_05945 [Bacteroidaceae bacterium]|nr:hypothetical protein [Bacteroidaceae bacterium]
MKKKKIIFSSSGGTPAMKLLMRLIENFGESEIGHIAAQIAATCRNTVIKVWMTFDSETPELHGSTAKCVNVNGGILVLEGENVFEKDYIIYIL